MFNLMLQPETLFDIPSYWEKIVNSQLTNLSHKMFYIPLIGNLPLLVYSCGDIHALRIEYNGHT